MAIPITTVYAQVQRHFPDVDQNTFLQLVNDVEEDILFQVCLFDDSQVTVNVVAGQTEYAVPDSMVRVWNAAWIDQANYAGFQTLVPTSIDFLDYNFPQWRSYQPSRPVYIYNRGSTIGLVPPPNQTTGSGYPYVALYERTADTPYTMMSSLPGTARTANAWVWRVCERFAIMRHPDDMARFKSYADAEQDRLLSRDNGRLARDKPAIRNKVRWIRAM